MQKGRKIRPFRIICGVTRLFGGRNRRFWAQCCDKLNSTCDSFVVDCQCQTFLIRAIARWGCSVCTARNSNNWRANELAADLACDANSCVAVHKRAIDVELNVVLCVRNADAAACEIKFAVVCNQSTIFDTVELCCLLSAQAACAECCIDLDASGQFQIITSFDTDQTVICRAAAYRDFIEGCVVDLRQRLAIEQVSGACVQRITCGDKFNSVSSGAFGGCDTRESFKINANGAICSGCAT